MLNWLIVKAEGLVWAPAVTEGGVTTNVELIDSEG
jgi:hypothetical protein